MQVMEIFNLVKKELDEDMVNTASSFEIQRYFQKEPRFSYVYSGNNIPEIKDKTILRLHLKILRINLEEYKSIGTHWIALYVNRNNVT